MLANALNALLYFPWDEQHLFDELLSAIEHLKAGEELDKACHELQSLVVSVGPWYQSNRVMRLLIKHTCFVCPGIRGRNSIVIFPSRGW